MIDFTKKKLPLKFIQLGVEIVEIIGDVTDYFDDEKEQEAMLYFNFAVALVKTQLTTEEYDKYIKKMSWRPYDHTSMLEECVVSYEVVLEILKERNTDEDDN